MLLCYSIYLGIFSPELFLFASPKSIVNTWGFPKMVYPQIIHFNRVFHYKPSILGYPYFWKHPLTCQVVFQVLGYQLQSKLGASDSSNAGKPDIGSSLWSTFIQAARRWLTKRPVLGMVGIELIRSFPLDKSDKFRESSIRKLLPRVDFSIITEKGGQEDTKHLEVAKN